MKNRVFSFLPRFSILLLFLGMVIGEAYAQSQTITGVVKDQTGEPLIGVNVMEKGTTNGSITDVDGKYSLTVNGSKAIVTFSYIGYLSQDITVGNQKMIDVTMKEDTEELEEVVVIGYGTAKKKDLTGAISTVKAENMEKETPRSVQDLLRASASGLSIGHISPEAAAGGAIGLVKDGDIIEIDIPERTINVKVSDEELAERRKAEEARGTKAFTPPHRQRVVSKALRAYGKMVSSADKGGVRVVED
jgi:hypothetical protein